MTAARYFQLCFAVSFLLHFLCRSGSLADRNLPTIVYRADFREPSNIFNNGFRALGINTDLLGHVSGNSCHSGPLKNTAFVATTAEEKFGLDFGFSLLWTTPDAGPFIYVYKIRATEFFYDINTSLEKAHKVTGDDQYSDAIMIFGHEAEWVAYNGIPRDLIMSVSIYKKGAKELAGELVRTEENEFCRSENTRANTDAFPVKGLFNSVSLVASNSPKPVSACFASCPATKLARVASGAACKMSQIVYQTPLFAQKDSFWDVLTNTKVDSLLPWKENANREGLHKSEKPER